MNNNQGSVVRSTDILARMLLQITSSASLVEQQYQPHLLPSPEGYYKLGERLPCIVPGRQYFTCGRDSNMNITYMEMTDIANTNDTVFDADGNPVANKYVMQNKRTLLFPRPTIPARGMSVIQKVIDYELACMSPMLHIPYAESKIISEFKPEFRDLVDISMLRMICRYTTADLHTFIGNDTWNYYYTKLTGIDLLVEKGPDHRVVEWYDMKYGKPHD